SPPPTTPPSTPAPATTTHRRASITATAPSPPPPPPHPGALPAPPRADRPAIPSSDRMFRAATVALPAIGYIQNQPVARTSGDVRAFPLPEIFRRGLCRAVSE